MYMRTRKTAYTPHAILRVILHVRTGIANNDTPKSKKKQKNILYYIHTEIHRSIK
jgi:hypothetical protein